MKLYFNRPRSDQSAHALKRDRNLAQEHIEAVFKQIWPDSANSRRRLEKKVTEKRALTHIVKILDDILFNLPVIT